MDPTRHEETVCEKVIADFEAMGADYLPPRETFLDVLGAPFSARYRDVASYDHASNEIPEPRRIKRVVVSHVCAPQSASSTATRDE